MSDGLSSNVVRLLPSGGRALVLGFSGRAANSHAHIGIYSEMEGQISRHLLNEHPDGLVLDLTNLTYESGDDLARVLCYGVECAGNPDLITVVIVSDNNRRGLISLVRDELLDQPSAWLFETEAEALNELDRRINSHAGHGTATENNQP